MESRKITLRYLAELIGANFLFFLVEALSHQRVHGMPRDAAQLLMLFLPAVPVVLMVVASVRYFQRVDEYLRLQILKTFAITAGITFLWTFLYGLLETLGFPRLSMYTICPAMGCTCAAVGVIRSLARR